jgi:hypothetical protein
MVSFKIPRNIGQIPPGDGFAKGPGLEKSQPKTFSDTGGDRTVALRHDFFERPERPGIDL